MNLSGERGRDLAAAVRIPVRIERARDFRGYKERRRASAGIYNRRREISRCLGAHNPEGHVPQCEGSVILSPGATFGPYRILAPLGSGGMGEVYRARDTRLNREVALKVLREEDAEDAELLTRFEQEARAASSLNHPNIVVVYETGHASVPGRALPLRYLTMELVDGEPLGSSLTGEPIPLRRFLDVATQLTDGIARAHESGIVHRDLKPANIFITPEGRVKILDFGLATLRAVADGDTQIPTSAGRLTSPGVAVGTIGYMSPEQARGEVPTAASDQFSIGCIFYEMLTGHQPFRGSSAAEMFSAANYQI